MASVPITILLYNGPLLCSFYVPIKYKCNETFVRRHSTNRLGVWYNNNNKSVHTIKQNSFKSSLEYVSVSNVM